ncbi:hypothetical protein N657DRAFT_502141 [Parathielavia appendiculata]|uniref:LIM zinc-binding domain-containing protein n=1 Tax=Parathielavia appendiculata TaxID=2587402 RepID=A0AAN6TX87_9PEZI|nr:hypothetical protein N657DRAFT_502141 [Parathielavia appendiculata]
MATIGRESRFMPTVKCSTCGLQVEISLMGEHTCAGSESPPEPTPPLPAASLFGRLMPTFGNPLTQKQQPRTPPQVDTTAANQPYIGQGQLTPISNSSGSQSSVSPQTPDGPPDAGKTDEYFATQIANNSPPPQQSTRPGGYGGLDDSSAYERPISQGDSPRKQNPHLMERMDDTDNVTSAFGPARQPSAAGPSGSGTANGRPGTSASNKSSTLGSGMSKAPRQNGYGDFFLPSKAPDNATEPPAPLNRSETFPRPRDRFAPPLRSPSAPLRSATLRSNRTQPPLNSPGGPDGQIPMTSERARRPSRGPDTSRPPPPRTGAVRPETPVVPTINLAEEFGIGNPYHTSSESTSSNNSENSSLPERRPSQASQASSHTSPPRSLSSRSGREPSDTSGFDNLVSNVQASVNDAKPKPLTIAPLKLPPRDIRDRPSPLSARPPRTGERGYDPRIDPAVQNPNYARGRTALPSPAMHTPAQDILAVQTHSDVLSPSTAGLPSPRWTSSPERIEDQRPSQAQPQPQAQPLQPLPQTPDRIEDRDRRSSQAQSQSQPQPQPQPQETPQPQIRPPTRSRSPSRPREPTANPARGNCKACGLAIKGKSISSADGRLTGRYHKPCFVCSTCREPFPSATFYVLDDKPYCELHYHRLNGSLCGSCGRGIEGQYLEDASAVKHHVGCFKCGECGMALRDGYFEVNGKAYCEKDAWKLAGGGVGGGLRPPNMGLPSGPRSGAMNGGGYNPSRLGPGGPRPRMEKRMTRLGMM